MSTAQKDLDEYLLNRVKTLEAELSDLQNSIIDGIKPFEEATIKDSDLANYANMRLRIYKLVMKLYRQFKKPVQELQVFNLLFHQIPVKNPGTIGARLRELAWPRNYKRWYGLLLLKVKGPAYIPNPNPQLKGIVKDCVRSESCNACESMPGCIRIALKGATGGRGVR